MASPQPELDNPAYRHSMAFFDCLTEESCYYILHLPKSGALNPDQHATLRRIFQHFDQQNLKAQVDIPVNSPKSETLSDLQKFFTSFLTYPTIIIMVVAVVVAVAVAAQLHPNATDYHSPEVDCLRIISSASSLESFPLPYPVDLRAHEDILNLHELPDLEILMSLNRTRSDVCSTLAATTQALVTYISNATKIYKSFPSEYTTDAFYADTLLVSEQLRIASSSVNHFAQVYYILQEDYYAVDYTTEEAFKQGQLSGLTRVLVYAQPRGLLQRLGLFDAHEAYLGPLEEKARKLEEAHLGVVALEREVQRVVQIEQVIGEVERSLQLLASAVRDTETSSHHHRVKSKKGRELIQRQLKEWYLQHIIQNRQLTESWMELLASVNRGEKEEELGMNFSTAWCPRSG